MQTLKHISGIIFTIMLLLNLSVCVFADYDAGEDTNLTSYKQTVTISDVSSGDSVYVYKLANYDADDNYNSYAVNSDFANYIIAIVDGVTTETEVLTYLAADTTDFASLINDYYAEIQTVGGSSYNLPTAYTSATETSGNEVEISVEPGWYLILGSTTVENSVIYNPVVIFVQMLDDTVNIYANGSNTPIAVDPVEIAMKAKEVPVIEKTVSDTSVAVGDILTFTLAIDLADYKEANVTELKITDTMTNLEYISNSIAMYSAQEGDGSFDPANELAIDTYYTVTEGTYETDNGTGSYTLTIDMNYDNIIANLAAGVESTVVYFTYNATVMGEAISGSESNEAVLDWTINNVSGSDDDDTEGYTYALEITKTAEDETNTLTGAVFNLYTEETGGTALQFIYVEDTVNGNYYRFPTAEELADSTISKVTDLEVDANGTFLIKGLDEGTYYLEEIIAPNGYYTPNARFEITITAERDLENNATSELKSAAVSATDGSNTNITGDYDLIGTNGIDTDDSSQYDATIKNSSTTLFPTTGGAGTVGLTAGGIVLIGIALLALLKGKKEKKQESEK